ncbi:electron transfer flavoprotein subunit alpha/FixB family protein [Amphritea balenae]|uniref:Electron transfer flavoprotein subunit alpha n=1 Tax=Amphritea balenae TaxID=452629 RepID=A0A3P1SR02_9GAMM|nr:FAD-binding protein [Amphritea balenae]RRC99334.1 electron transfer flavoprotein subunit alpha/FixB family protein [Amphritea balenae]GGK71956.1 electron transfer flavoprotein subunit alpha [Amphritea balenae]
MTILVIAEHDNQQLKAATHHAVSAALQLAEKTGTAVNILVAGQACSDVAEQASTIAGIAQVLVADCEALAYQLPENLVPMLAALVKEESVTHLLAPATTQGKNLLPGVAALLDVAQISEITTIVDSHTFIRPVYAGNALATVQSCDSVQVITVRGTAFEAAATEGGDATITALAPITDSGLSRFISEEVSQSDRPELTAARTIISGGRGMQNGDNFSLLEKVADKIGAAVGASRAAVDAGFVANDMQVGQTGKIVAPDLYIAVGISGAIQHLAGMKDSKVIVAINKDEEAPIFGVADYGLYADLFDAVPELDAQLS